MICKYLYIFALKMQLNPINHAHFAHRYRDNRYYDHYRCYHVNKCISINFGILILTILTLLISKFIFMHA